MNDQEDKPPESLEGMLQHWGADQAAREALVPSAPVAKRPKRSRLATVLYWGSAAAAAGILIAAALLYFRPTWLGRDGGAGGAPPSARQRIRSLETQLARARGALDSASGALTEADKKLSDAAVRVEKAEAEAARLARMQQLQQKSVDQMQGKLREATRARITAEGDLKIASAQLKGARLQLSAATAERDQLRKDLKAWPGRLAEATAELDDARKKHQEAVAARKKVEDRLVALTAARRAMLTDLQRAFLGLAPEEADSLAVRQAAAKRARMTRRLIVLRPTVQREPTRRLVDKLEVAFSRLSMLDASDPAAAESFGRLVVGGGLLEQIDEVLADGAEPPKTRMWLLEASLILLGVDRVG